ncbi:hypothetical protein MOD67_13945 [Bacillus licheniformis]|uniref:hypothetical protein n=1 Tax=Bacillus TaxID=1386 RepID=UPI0020C8C0AF|nr:hypothetical protein [Bacillus haynesii]MCP8973152.1 hypothetical protein [Bacillus licheniformis]MCY7861123.1 hypothetical protein [Bacillus haynesii]MCY8015548.1 hypothetical protein [Bacillus haynesii]MCY8291547.1 hypothetical protein [Bacillus haynesii]MCY8549171.1 hypothetical protein [Bacillus haynesii]
MNLGLDLIVLLLISLGVRAFLFEIKFQYSRQLLREKHELFEIFLDCAFCNGFWTGLFGYLIVFGVDWTTLPFAILVGSAAYYLNLFTRKLK